MMIGVTVRNDYTLEDAENYESQNVPIGNSTSIYHSWSFLKLNVNLYSWDDSVIPAEEVTTIYSPNPNGCREFALRSGETTQVLFCLLPSSLNIDYYEIFVDYITDYPQTNVTS